ncbi:MAG TPA: FAD synthetase family protein [Candidatus Limiplasma sp.]|nr:FAD synthetase family protein [Candidatus Limiplasma sp.]HPS81400.1 FAD synthetase family protein [Candidatus Limiplasma sp.]
MRICLDGKMSAEASVVVLGMFDGVHIGHQVLLAKAKAIARREGLPLVVQTFTEHPLCLLDPTRCPPLLTTLDERIRLMEKAGVDIFCAQPFTKALMDLPPEDFVGRLVSQWKPKTVVVGFNYSFGAKGAGTPALLGYLGGALGFKTISVPAVRLAGRVVSATSIRERLDQGYPQQARWMLGRLYCREVEVVEHAGTQYRLCSLPNGKLELPKGAYRALIVTQQGRYPVLAQADGAGITVCALPKTIVFTGHAALHYIAELMD